MADETIELTEVQAILDDLSDPSDEEFMQSVRGYSERAIGSAAAKRGLTGNFPEQWWVGETGSLAITQSEEGEWALAVASAYDVDDNGVVAYFANEIASATVVIYSTGRIESLSGDGTTQLLLRTNAARTSDALVVLDELAATVFRLDKSANPVLHGTHAAPADGDLNAGDCALWFDQTDGAAKLKIKGKSANGTVVQGEVALT